MEQHDNIVTDTSAERQPRDEEDIVVDEDPPALDVEAGAQAGVQVPVRLELDVWRWLLAQGGDYGRVPEPCG